MMINIIYMVSNIYALGLMAYGLCSWFNGEYSQKTRQFLSNYYEPILQKIRLKLMELGWTSSVDLAPMVLFMTIMVGRSLLFSLFTLPN